jgi:hypothetical protein
MMEGVSGPRQEHVAIKQLRSFLLSKCPSELQAKLTSVLDDRHTFLLLHERFVNLPLQLVPALHKSVREDLAWAAETEVRLQNSAGLI